MGPDCGSFFLGFSADAGLASGHVDYHYVVACILQGDDGSAAGSFRIIRVCTDNQDLRHFGWSFRFRSVAGKGAWAEEACACDGGACDLEHVSSVHGCSLKVCANM